MVRIRKPNSYLVYPVYPVKFLVSSFRLLILAYLRCSGFYVAVALVGDADDAFWGDLAAGYFECSRDGAAFEEAFAGAEGDGDYHELHRIDEVVFEERLKQIGAAHDVDIGAVLLF